MRRVFTLCTFIATTSVSFGQQVQKCCGSSSSTFLLGNTGYASHTQCLYTPDQLSGATDGYIVRLYYRYGVSGIGNGNTLGELRIGLAQTTATAFSSVTFLTQLETVLETPSFTIAPGASGNWFSIDLTTPFAYDPSQSLVVDIQFETSANESFGTMSTSGNTGRKIMSSTTDSPTGEFWDTLQDLGFDLVDNTGMSSRALTGTSLFPNPTAAQADLVWATTLETNATLSITDATGRLVSTEQISAGSTRAMLDLSTMGTGIYIVQLRDHSGSLFTQRLARE